FYPLNDNLKVTYKKKLTVEEKMISYMNTAEKSFSTYQKTALIPETYRIEVINAIIAIVVVIKKLRCASRDSNSDFTIEIKAESST
ncbi:MAG TPA: hypothetical protein VI754_15670, partial [Bacteriovoracaceae bacterium]|nr:hypothetical protein [Bacteriovoracaceae bacterium]